MTTKLKLAKFVDELRDSLQAILAADDEESDAMKKWDDDKLSESQDRIANAIISKVLAREKAEATLSKSKPEPEG